MLEPVWTNHDPDVGELHSLSANQAPGGADEFSVVANQDTDLAEFQSLSANHGSLLAEFQSLSTNQDPDIGDLQALSANLEPDVREFLSTNHSLDVEELQSLSTNQNPDLAVLQCLSNNQNPYVGEFQSLSANQDPDEGEFLSANHNPHLTELQCLSTNHNPDLAELQCLSTNHEPDDFGQLLSISDNVAMDDNILILQDCDRSSLSINVLLMGEEGTPEGCWLVSAETPLEAALRHTRPCSVLLDRTEVERYQQDEGSSLPSNNSVSKTDQRKSSLPSLVRSSEPLLQCHLCGVRTFAGKGRLKSHMRNNCTGRRLKKYKLMQACAKKPSSNVPQSSSVPGKVDNKPAKMIKEKSIRNVEQRSLKRVKKKEMPVENVKEKTVKKVKEVSAQKVNAERLDKKVKKFSIENVKENTVKRVKKFSVQNVKEKRVERIKKVSAEKVNAERLVKKAKKYSVQRVNAERLVENVKKVSAEKVNAERLDEKVKKVSAEKINAERLVQKVADEPVEQVERKHIKMRFKKLSLKSYSSNFTTEKTSDEVEPISKDKPRKKRQYPDMLLASEFSDNLTEHQPKKTRLCSVVVKSEYPCIQIKSMLKNSPVKRKHNNMLVKSKNNNHDLPIKYEPRPYGYCAKCRNYFESEFELNKHEIKCKKIKLETKPLSYSCTVCFSECYSKNALKIHTKRAHANQIPAIARQLPEIPAFARRVPKIAETVKKVSEVPVIARRVPKIAETVKKVPELLEVASKLPQIAVQVPEVSSINNSLKIEQKDDDVLKFYESVKNKFKRNSSIHCITCNKDFLLAIYFKSHLKQCYDNNDFVCPFCTRMKSHIPGKILNHIKKHFLTTTVNDCTKCKKSFLDSFNHSVHFNKQHLGFSSHMEVDLEEEEDEDIEEIEVEEIKVTKRKLSQSPNKKLDFNLIQSNDNCNSVDSITPFCSPFITKFTKEMSETALENNENQNYSRTLLKEISDDVRVTVEPVANFEQGIPESYSCDVAAEEDICDWSEVVNNVNSPPAPSSESEHYSDGENENCEPLPPNLDKDPNMDSEPSLEISVPETFNSDVELGKETENQEVVLDSLLVTGTVSAEKLCTNVENSCENLDPKDTNVNDSSNINVDERMLKSESLSNPCIISESVNNLAKNAKAENTTRHPVNKCKQYSKEKFSVNVDECVEYLHKLQSQNDSLFVNKYFIFCNICHTSFYLEDYVKHLLICLDNEQFSCPFCLDFCKPQETKAKCLEHIREHFVTTDETDCFLCGDLFLNEFNMMKHASAVHKLNYN